MLLGAVVVMSLELKDKTTGILKERKSNGELDDEWLIVLQEKWE